MDQEIITLITTLIAAIAAIIEWYRERKATAQAAYIQEFYDDESPAVDIPQGTPTRNYKMSDAVKEFILHGHSVEDLSAIIEQITAAEARMDATGQYFEYTIKYSHGWYVIAWGQIKTSGVGA